MKNLIRKSIMIIIMIPMLFLGNQIIDKRIATDMYEVKREIPYEFIKLKQSIESYSSQIEIIRSEIRNKIYFDEKPYKVLKDAKN